MDPEVKMEALPQNQRWGQSCNEIKLNKYMWMYEFIGILKNNKSWSFLNWTGEQTTIFKSR